MNNTQKDRLERNLSKSASGAKPFWPRVLIGPEVEKQGYIDPKLLPIQPNMNLGQFYQEYLDQIKFLNRRIDEVNSLISSLEGVVTGLITKNTELESRIEALESFKID